VLVLSLALYEEMADKRRIRGPAGSGANLTPKEAKDALALPVYAVLAGQAQAVFPTSNLASDSSLVGIFAHAGVSCRVSPNGKTITLPIWVNGRQWRRAVLPVLQDPRWNNALPVWQATAATNLTTLVDMLGNALAESFHEAGYGPLP
jgi:hypothetical protein